LGQLQDLVFGHWVDWIGPAHHRTPLVRAIAILAAGAIGAALVFGPRLEADEREPLRCCAGLGLIPILALVAGSIAVRPMFAIRYVAPSVAVMVLLVAGLLSYLSPRTFRLSTVAIVTALVCLFPYYPWYEPWRDIARFVSNGDPTEPVFFEAGFVDSDEPLSNRNAGFPHGYFRVPFEYYFSGTNPRRVIDPSRPAEARQTITGVAIDHGAWLITGFTNEKARAEMPTGCFDVDKKAVCSYAALYHIVPIANCPRH
jgi:hypothetical protein